MKARCQNAARPEYAEYGGRGVSICQSWQSFPAFSAWAADNGYRDDLQLDRRDVDGNYGPENCRWVPGLVNIGRRWLPRDGGYIEHLSGFLSDEEIRSAVQQVRPYKIFDGNGLYLHVLPTGRKVWRYKFIFDGREKLLTIGRYPAISLENARELHFAARTRVLSGRDPAAVKVDSKRRARRRKERRIQSGV